MLRTITRLTLAVGLALCLSLAFTPLGCGASHGVEASPHGGEGPGVPSATVSALQACADQGKDRFKETEYALHFDVEVREDGHVDRVKRKQSRPADRAMESCMADAIEGMRVPLTVVRELISQAEAVSPESRRFVGNPLVAAVAAVGAIELVPVLVGAAAVTIIVGVTVYVSEELSDKGRKRRKRVDKCMNMYVRCADKGGSCMRMTDWGLKLCALCFNDCKEPKPYTYNECYPCGFSDPD